MSATARWRAVVGAVCGLTVIATFVVNRRRYPKESLIFVAKKTALDVSVLGLLCAFPVLTPLLITFTVMWLMSFLKLDGVYEKVAAFFSGMALGFLSLYVLEVVIGLGIFSVNVFTGRFLEEWYKVGKEKP